MTNLDNSNTHNATANILVLGATGPTGRLIVSQAQKLEHHVTILARSPEKARDFSGVKVIIGDARDETVLRQAVAGQDAVISALGTPASPFREVTQLSTATKALVNAMETQGVSRLISITGIGAGDSAGHGGLLFDNVIFPLLLRKVYVDKNRQETIIRESGLEWTIVRPSVLNNKPGRGNINARTDLAGFHGGSISRSDVADFVLDQVGKDDWLRQAPLISWE